MFIQMYKYIYICTEIYTHMDMCMRRNPWQKHISSTDKVLDLSWQGALLPTLFLFVFFFFTFLGNILQKK